MWACYGCIYYLYTNNATNVVLTCIQLIAADINGIPSFIYSLGIRDKQQILNGIMRVYSVTISYYHFKTVAYSQNSDIKQNKKRHAIIQYLMTK